MSEAPNTLAAAVSNAINSGKFGTKIKLELNKTVEVEKGGKKVNEYKKIGEADLPMPVLSDFGIDAEQAKDEKGQLEFEDGIPVYVNPVFDWLMTAISARVSAQARNKFSDGTIKEGASLADDFATLTAVGERNGEALKARHDAKKAFVAYLEASNKKATVVKLLSDVFGDPNSIMYAKQNVIEALSAHLPVFTGKLSEVDRTRFANTLNKIVQAIEGRTAMLPEDEADMSVTATA